MKPAEAGAGSPRPLDLAAFASSCTLHGLGQVFVPGAMTPRRAVWAGAFVAALGAFLYQVGERVAFYAQYPHVTALDEQESRQLPFPAITLCNFNRIRRSRLTPDDLYWLGPELLGVQRADFARYLAALGRPADFAGFFPSKSFDLRAFYQRAGHALPDMLLSCRFRARECGPENFTTVSRAEPLRGGSPGPATLARSWCGRPAHGASGAQLEAPAEPSPWRPPLPQDLLPP